MGINDVIGMVGHYGYGALFFCLWLGIVGMPIPDEVVVMTGGLVTSLGLLKIIPAFIVTYLGVVSGLTIGYVLGLFIGAPVLTRLAKKKKMQKYISKSNQLIEKYGTYALCISYFFPVVRHVVPYLVGISKMSFRRYALFSYTTGLVWTLLYFSIGRFAKLYIVKIGKLVDSYGLYTLIITVVVGIGIWVVIEKIGKPLLARRKLSYAKRDNSHHR